VTIKRGRTCHSDSGEPRIERKCEMGFLRALEFLTIIPSPLRREATPREVGRSLVYFPVIGLGIGGLLYGLDQLFHLALPAALVNILLLIALVVLTGAHHLDGFIDTCDGMAAGRSPEERLAIMRDSRVGGLGVVGGCLLLLAKYVSLLVLPGGYRLEGLILMSVLQGAGELAAAGHNHAVCSGSVIASDEGVGPGAHGCDLAHPHHHGILFEKEAGWTYRRHLRGNQ